MQVGRSFQLMVTTSPTHYQLDLESLMTTVRTYASDLRSLDLTITKSTYMHDDSPIQLVVQSLLHLVAHAHLQHLTIRLSQDDARVDKNPWDELQDLLVGIRFPEKRRVSVGAVFSRFYSHGY